MPFEALSSLIPKILTSTKALSTMTGLFRYNFSMNKYPLPSLTFSLILFLLTACSSKSTPDQLPLSPIATMPQTVGHFIQ